MKKHLHLRRMCYRGAVSQWGQNDRWDWIDPGIEHLTVLIDQPTNLLIMNEDTDKENGDYEENDEEEAH